MFDIDKHVSQMGRGILQAVCGISRTALQLRKLGERLQEQADKWQDENAWWRKGIKPDENGVYPASIFGQQPEDPKDDGDQWSLSL